MSDLKSKLPDFKELGNMAGKLFKDIRSSVSEIVKEYKEKHPSAAPAEKSSDVPVEKSPEPEKTKLESEEAK